MYLTVKILEEHGACGPGLKWFERRFPEGADLSQILQEPSTTPYFLNWGLAHLSYTEEEKNQCWKRLEIENSNGVYESNQVSNSSVVSRSSVVKDSQYIFSSHHVSNCANVTNSTEIHNSFSIYGSNFIESSSRVLLSNTVKNGEGVVGSDYVINSRWVINGKTITNSAFIGALTPGGASSIRDSYFIANSSNLSKSLFCFGANGGEYMLFNKKIELIDYEFISGQLKTMLGDWTPELVKGKCWPTYAIPLDMPQIQRNVYKQFASFPENLIRWIKTLPGYDQTIMYSITLNTEFLK